MGYLESRNKEIATLHTIYSKEFPEFLHKYLEAPEVLRLGGIGQNCGCDYVKIPQLMCKYFYSRLDHSLGVALIIWNFTKDKKQTLSGLFHDISTPVFSHVIDFLKGDYLMQEATEKDTRAIIASSKVINECLKQDGISIEEVCDYKLYTVADNKSPKLCADRVEYTFQLQLVMDQKWTIEEIMEMYSDMLVLKNESCEDELGFNTKELAEKFTLGGLRNGIVMSSDEDKFAMQFIAKIIEQLIKNHELDEENLYTLNEDEIISMMRNSNRNQIRTAWEHYINMKSVKTSKTQVEGKYCMKIKVKKRYIDPLVFPDSRASELFYKVKEGIKHFIDNEEEHYVYTDYKF